MSNRQIWNRLHLRFLFAGMPHIGDDNWQLDGPGSSRSADGDAMSFSRGLFEQNIRSAEVTWRAALSMQGMKRRKPGRKLSAVEGRGYLLRVPIAFQRIRALA